MRSDRRAAELAGLTQATALRFCQYLAMKRDKTNFFVVLVILVFVFVFVFAVVVFVVVVIVIVIVVVVVVVVGVVNVVGRC